MITNKYDHIIFENKDAEITIDKQDQAVILKAYDYGLDMLNKEEIQQMDRVIAKLKNCVLGIASDQQHTSRLYRSTNC